MVFVDHYIVLGLPTGKEGIKLSEKQISRAFKRKALEVHPDKRLDVDPATANSEFQKLQQSYQILIDITFRQQFNTALRQQKQEARQQQFPPNAKECKSRKRSGGGGEWWEKVGKSSAARWKKYEEECGSAYEEEFRRWWKNMSSEEKKNWRRKSY